MYLEQNNCVYKKIELESKHLTDYSLYCHVEFPFQFSDKMVNKRDILKFINLYYLNDKKWMLYVLFCLKVTYGINFIAELDTPNCILVHSNNRFLI